MTYVMSDIHGEYEKYMAMLEAIKFSEKDELYVLGDVVDRGPEPVKVLQDMCRRQNVIPLIGNHDLTAAWLLRRLCTEITEENYATGIHGGILEAIHAWLEDGGQTTLDGFYRLSPDEREGLLDYLGEFLPYEALTVGGRHFLLVHGGIPYEKRQVPIETQLLEDLITTRPDHTRRYFRDTYLVTGHTPTITIGSEYRGKIYQGQGHIVVDCGACFDLPLGCIRLEDFSEFYTE